MATKVEKSIVVNVPVDTVYNQWTQFEEFPHFMGGITEIRQLDDTRLHWVAEIAGVKRQWEARILEQVPNEKVAWAATEGATNAGAVYFTPAGAGQTNVRLELEYDPEGLVETVGDKLGVVERRVQADLEKFKSFIEDAGYATGAWRGTVPGAVGTPGVESAQGTQGDSGKAGVSAKAVAAGLTGAAAAAAGVAAAAKARSGDKADETPEVEVVAVDMDVPGASSAADGVAIVEDEPLDTGFPADPAAPLPPDVDADRRI